MATLGPSNFLFPGGDIRYLLYCISYKAFKICVKKKKFPSFLGEGQKTRGEFSRKILCAALFFLGKKFFWKRGQKGRFSEQHFPGVYFRFVRSCSSDAR